MNPAIESVILNLMEAQCLAWYLRRFGLFWGLKIGFGNGRKSLLIEDGDKLILIDTGLGNKQSEKFLVILMHPDDLFQSYKQRFHPDDITDVF